MSIDDFSLFDDIEDENSSSESSDVRVSCKLSQRLSHKTSYGRDSESEIDECLHINVYDDGTKTTCVDCGQEINCDSISFDKEWKNKNNDSRKSQRCTQRKQENKDIMKDIEAMDIPSDVKSRANDIFIKISNGRIFRGDKRKGIIYTCVFNAFDHFPEYEKQKDVLYLQNYFKLPRNVISRANNEYNILSHNCGIIAERKKVYVTPKNYIPSLIENIGGGDIEINEVIRLYEMIGNKSRILSVSRPESYAAGLVYYYYIQKKKDTDINKFVRDSNSGLSPLTIKKNMEEIDKILAKVLSRV